MSLPNIFNNEVQIASFQTHIMEDYTMLIIADTAYSVHLNTVSDLSACNAWGSALVAS
jgi:glycine betaine/choline ABC-type transport system substrate-binding protein